MVGRRSKIPVSVYVVSTHRLSATGIAETLRRELNVSAKYAPPDHPIAPSSLVILLAHLEPAKTVPRILHAIDQTGSATVFVMDSFTPNEHLRELTAHFRLAAFFDTREGLSRLIEVVGDTLANRHHTPDQLTMQWSRALTHGAQRLSKRENEVAVAYCGPARPSIEQIAASLGLSPHTVRAHLANVRRKLVHSYTGNREALRNALHEQGWLN